MSKGSFFSPDDFLSEFKLTNSSQYKKYEFLNHWQRIVGKSVSSHTHVISFKSNTLYVQVNDPMWKNELTLNKHQLIKKINEQFPQTDLKEIVFTYYVFKNTSKGLGNDVTGSPMETQGVSPHCNFEIPTDSLSKQLADEKKKLSNLPEGLRESLAKLKLTWDEIKSNPSKDVFPNSTPSVDSNTTHSVKLDFLNYYFPLNTIRSEFLDFSLDE